MSALYPYSIETIDLAAALQSAVRGPSLADLSCLQDVCLSKAQEQARTGSGKVDVESEIQALLVAALKTDTLRKLGVVAVHHSPMGGGRSPREGAVLKRQGARAGWPDLDLRIVDARGICRSVLLELKAPGGRVSQEQKSTIAALREAGFEAVVAVGLQEACALMVRVLRGESI